MKSDFPGYFALSPAKIKNLWDTGIFVFDANILLGLYRYSDATREEFFETLEMVKNRCWLPHQAVKEYFNNRLSVIGKQEDAYSDIIKSMDEMESKFKNSHQHPFLGEKAFERLCEGFSIAKDELCKSKAFHTKRINDDDVLVSIEKIFKNRIGGQYSEEDLKALITEGEDRYKKNIPPGFRDNKKQDATDETKKYGDWILWKQLLQKTESSKYGVIFVCDDRKDDWWELFRGKTLGARPELVKEFKKVSDSDFHMYSSDRFLEFAGQYLDRPVSAVALSEMRELKHVDEYRRRRILNDRQMNDRRIKLDRLDSEEYQRRIEMSRHEYKEKFDEYKNERNYLYHLKEKLSKHINMGGPSMIDDSEFETKEEISDRLRELDRMESELDLLRNRKLRRQLGEGQGGNNTTPYY